MGTSKLREKPPVEWVIHRFLPSFCHNMPPKTRLPVACAHLLGQPLFLIPARVEAIAVLVQPLLELPFLVLLLLVATHYCLPMASGTSGSQSLATFLALLPPATFNGPGQQLGHNLMMLLVILSLLLL